MPRISAPAAFLILHLLCVPLIAQAQDPFRGWQWQNPLPQGNSINSIRFASDKKRGWAIGTNGVVLTTDRAQRLRPKVAVVLDSKKKPYFSRTKILELGGTSDDASPKGLQIKRVLPAGAYGINPTDYFLPADFKVR